MNSEIKFEQHYMDCPICGEMFSYMHMKNAPEDPPVFIRCSHCKASFPQPVVDDVNILENSDALDAVFGGATTADVTEENLLDKVESLLNEAVNPVYIEPLDSKEEMSEQSSDKIER